MSIKNQQLLYHITDIQNIVSILRHGLIPRRLLNNFVDIADPGILQIRATLNLDTMVPFHFFAKNPFDGRVQSDLDGEFVYITVRRNYAASQNWLIIPCHPLANEQPQIMSYTEGMETINWSLMDRRNYQERECRNVCMAECLSPAPVTPNHFFAIYTKTDHAKNLINQIKGQLGLSFYVDKNETMFLG